MSDQLTLINAAMIVLRAMQKRELEHAKVLKERDKLGNKVWRLEEKSEDLEGKVKDLEGMVQKMSRGVQL